MRDPERLCLGCMEELVYPGTRCEKCGFDRDEYENHRNVRILPSYTILAGKYLLGRVLGEGGFGVTYLAWDLNRECRVAIKEYFPSGLATRDTRLGTEEALIIMPGENAAYYRTGLKNFAEEGKNLARFQHLNGIVSVLDFFRDNETAYIVMDYVEGVNLKQYLELHYKENGEHTPLSEQMVLAMMQPVLWSLQEIHKAGIIHRDISPENIIRSGDGKITLIDFGAARATTGTETKSLTIMLKHGYAPPEQYRTHGRQGPWTDIYAICATMYHLMSGYLPVESIERVFEDKLQPLWKMNDSIRKEISDVIEKGMAVRWEERYQTVEEMYGLLYSEPVKEIQAEEKLPIEEGPIEEPQPVTEEKSAENPEPIREEKRQNTTCVNDYAERKHRDLSRVGKVLVVIVFVTCLVWLSAKYYGGNTGPAVAARVESGTVSAVKKISDIADPHESVLLISLYEELENGNYSEVLNFFNDGRRDEIEDGTCYFLSNRGIVSEIDSGTGMILTTTGAYLGEVKDNVRCGTGVQFGTYPDNAEKFVVIEGDWSNDKVNGDCTCVENWVGTEESSIKKLTITLAGNVQENKFDGQVIMIWENESVIDSCTIQASDGAFPCIRQDENGKYVYAEGATNYWSYESEEALKTAGYLWDYQYYY